MDYGATATGVADISMAVTAKEAALSEMQSFLSSTESGGTTTMPDTVPGVTTPATVRMMLKAAVPFADRMEPPVIPQFAAGRSTQVRLS